STGFIVKLGNFYFVAYHNETTIDLDRCNWQKLLHHGFLLNADTQVVVQVPKIKCDCSKLLLKLSKDIQELDATHLSLLYNDALLAKPFGGFADTFCRCANFIEVALHLKKENTDIFGPN